MLPTSVGCLVLFVFTTQTFTVRCRWLSGGMVTGQWLGTRGGSGVRDHKTRQIAALGGVVFVTVC
jgi:hypothetical protein